MELDFIGKINPLDQYELSIRLNETTKFKTRIKIERNGYQVWESRNFSINPMIEDYMYIKVVYRFNGANCLHDFCPVLRAKTLEQVNSTDGKKTALY